MSPERCNCGAPDCPSCGQYACEEHDEEWEPDLDEFYADEEPDYTEPDPVVDPYDNW